MIYLKGVLDLYTFCNWMYFLAAKEIIVIICILNPRYMKYKKIPEVFDNFENKTYTVKHP